jgi:hypothetical protein
MESLCGRKGHGFIYPDFFNRDEARVCLSCEMALWQSCLSASESILNTFVPKSICPRGMSGKNTFTYTSPNPLTQPINLKERPLSNPLIYNNLLLF